MNGPAAVIKCIDFNRSFILISPVILIHYS
uniref:Uncharacterized protein n=1 Tax=Macrostomum lignano TaxID=282301 RepID=A0A1I8FDF3_9PLAT